MTPVFTSTTAALHKSRRVFAVRRDCTAPAFHGDQDKAPHRYDGLQYVDTVLAGEREPMRVVTFMSARLYPSGVPEFFALSAVLVPLARSFGSTRFDYRVVFSGTHYDLRIAVPAARLYPLDVTDAEYTAQRVGWACFEAAVRNARVP